MRTLRDCMYGQAIGDALGVPFESFERGSFTCTGMADGGPHGKPLGTWSDDTSMALALCDSIRVCGGIDCEVIRSRFEAWLLQGAYTVDGTFGVGRTTEKALEEGKGQAGERDNGNGSLMRTLPLAFTDATDDEVRAVSAITHANPLSTESCVHAVHFARMLMQGESPARAAAKMWDGDVAKVERDAVPSGGYVLDTLLASTWCLLTTDDYPSCVLAAVNLGGDTDTTAAVAGGFAGIVYGLEGMPVTWLNALRGKDLIDACLF